MDGKPPSVLFTRRQKSPSSLWARPELQAAAIALCVLFLAGSIHLDTALNRALSDQHARFLAASQPRPFPANLLVIGIDDASVRKFGRLRNWSRARYATLLDRTRTAKVVGLDILFTEADARDPAGDAALVKAVRENGRVVLPAFLYNEIRPVNNETQAQTATFLARVPRFEPTEVDEFPEVNPQSIEPPLPALVRGAAALSYANVNADPDGVYRTPVVAQEIVLDRADRRLLPHFTAAIVSLATGEPVDRLLRGLPLTEGAVTLRSVARRGGSLRQETGTPVPYLSFADAVRADPATFANKIVLIGETVTGTADVRPNAIDNGLRGVELSAEIVANLIGAFFPLRPLPAPAGWLLIAGAVGLPITLFRVTRSIRRASLGSAGVLAGILLLIEAAYFSGGFVPPWAEVLLGFTAATLVSGIQRAGAEAAKRRQLQDAFSAYVAPEMVEELVRNPEALLAGTQRVQCAILFSDIRSFTTYAEQNPPEVVDRQMREYLTAMSAAVFARYHFLDKFVGDAVMALFGDLFPHAPKRQNFAAEAVLCAVEMLDRLDRLNHDWQDEGLPTFRIGIGIHYGDALFGNVGSADSDQGARRVQVTALGDSVNLASRLQTATKEYGVTLIVSNEVKQGAESSPLLAERVVWHDLGSLTVRGRERETRIWSVVRTRLEA